MTDVFTWTLAEIRTRWREETGRSSTSDISDANVNKLINDYYINHFSHDANIVKFDIFITQALSATDNGEYLLDSGIDRLDDPITLNGKQIILERNREKFFTDFPEDEQYITAPTLVIGTSDTTKVKHSAFSYRVQEYSYYKASSEVALTGSTIPQNKYGAWSLKINSSGAITVAAAAGNVTGYATVRLALEALIDADSDNCYMGYVTAISADSGGFIPGATALNNGAVTATYTDGKFETRNEPEVVLLYGSKMYVRPKACDVYEIKALSISDRPVAFADDASVPADTKWGPAIARGAAILYLDSKGQKEKVDGLLRTTEYYRSTIQQDRIKRLMGGEIQRSY